MSAAPVKKRRPEQRKKAAHSPGQLPDIQKREAQSPGPFSDIQKKAFVAVALVIAVVVAVFAGVRLVEIYRVNQAAEQSYAELADSVCKDRDVDTTSAAIPDRGVDFAKLKAINEDAVAWLYVPDTPLDYPVMAADDYNWYLYHLPDGTYNANGSLFLDYNHKPDFSSTFSIIYGHNMASGAMFGSLEGYKDQAYFEQHPEMYLYTEDGSFRIDLVYGCVIAAGEWRDRAFMYEQNLDSLLSYAAHNTTFSNGVEASEGDRFVVLSTCSYEFDDARYAVIGILREGE